VFEGGKAAEVVATVEKQVQHGDDDDLVPTKSEVTNAAHVEEVKEVPGKTA
jgi:hypothetical protein